MRTASWRGRARTAVSGAAVPWVWGASARTAASSWHAKVLARWRSGRCGWCTLQSTHATAATAKPTSASASVSSQRTVPRSRETTGSYTATPRPAATSRRALSLKCSAVTGAAAAIVCTICSAPVAITALRSHANAMYTRPCTCADANERCVVEPVPGSTCAGCTHGTLSPSIARGDKAVFQLTSLCCVFQKTSHSLAHTHKGNLGKKLLIMGWCVFGG